MGIRDVHTSLANSKPQPACAWETICQETRKRKAEPEVLLQYAAQYLERTLELGGRIAFELPAGNQEERA